MSRRKKTRPSSRIKRLVFLGAIASNMVLVLCLHGGDISRGLWDRFRLFPEAAMFFYPYDAALAEDIGIRSFNTSGRKYGYDIERAERYLYRALELNPTSPQAWYQLGRIDFLKGALGPAIVKLNRQIMLHGGAHMPVYYVRGLTYAFAGRLDEAEADFLTFLDWKEQSWAANNDLSWIYFRKGDYEKALMYAENGLAHAPDNPWLLIMQGVSLMNLGEKERAAEIFAHARDEAKKLTEEDWIRAYPGNNPRVAGQGLAEILQTIEMNLALVD